MEIEEILLNKDPAKLKTLFSFSNEENDLVIMKFNLWSRYSFPKYFTSEDANFHRDIDLYNLQCYRGEISSFVNIAFRGAAKTARTKLFLAFCICNDLDHSRRYIKVLSEDGVNSKQIVTDIYNMLINPEVYRIYPEIFRRTHQKREETMASFTTTTGIKMIADTVGTDQRGAIQEDARPDLIWFEDFENRASLRSAVKTKAIWDNMEEARTGLAKGGSCIYTCNYISERGNVHVLVNKEGPRNIVLIIPIIDKGIPTWNRYTIAEIEQMKIDDDDFEGERMCQPSAGPDVMFDRPHLQRMIPTEPLRVVGELKMFKTFNASHRYAGGADVAGGVGLDSSTHVIIDFDTIPCKVVATYKNNLVKPDTFAYELKSHGDRYGECLIAPEKNNHGHATIAILKTIYDNIFTTQVKDTKQDMLPVKESRKELGWHTNAASKPKMLFALKKAVDDGLLDLSDKDLIQEAKGYSRDDLMDKEDDPRLTTRHFDLLIACAIAWQMKDEVQYDKPPTQEEKEEQAALLDKFDRFSVL